MERLSTSNRKVLYLDEAAGLAEASVGEKGDGFKFRRFRRFNRVMETLLTTEQFSRASVEMAASIETILQGGISTSSAS